MLINRVDLLKVILEVSSLPNAQKNIGFFSFHFFIKMVFFGLSGPDNVGECYLYDYMFGSCLFPLPGLITPCIQKVAVHIPNTVE